MNESFCCWPWEKQNKVEEPIECPWTCLEKKIVTGNLLAFCFFVWGEKNCVVALGFEPGYIAHQPHDPVGQASIVSLPRQRFHAHIDVALMT